MRSLKCIFAVVMIALSASAAAAQDRPQVVAVNKALHYFATRLLEDAADVVFPVPQGVDPSFWRPSIADISTIQSADLILLNGAGFATWVDRVSLPRSRIVNTSVAIEDKFIVTESITHSHGDGGEHSHEGVATYLWLDPTLAIAQAEAIAAAAIARNLAPPDEVNAKLADLNAELTDLDAASQKALNVLKGSRIIATHPRYQYFARRYSLSITSLEWEAGAMPTDEQLADLESLKTQTNAHVLIWEAEPPLDAIKAAKALGLQSVVFDPWSAKGSEGSFTAAYSDAVSKIAKVIGLNSN